MPKKTDFPVNFDFCCPGEDPSPKPANKAYRPPAEVEYPDADNIPSDERGPPVDAVAYQGGPIDLDEETGEDMSSVHPVPPPPAPEDEVMISDMEADGAAMKDTTYDPPANETTMDVSDDMEDRNLPVDPELDQYGEDESVEIPPTNVSKRYGNDSRLRNRILLVCLCCLLLVIVLLLAIGYATGAFGDDDTDRTGVPAYQCVPEASRTECLQAYVTTISYADASAFEDPASAETRSLNWIIADDPLQLDARNANATSQTRIKHRYALGSLFFASDFVWTNQTGWLLEEAPEECTWFGIGCIDGKIRTINLFENNLSGELPPDVALLDTLIDLNLANNALDGAIPASMGTMSNLEGLYLDRNTFVQDLANTFDFSGMTSLTIMWLSQNGFFGTLPPSLFQAISLQIVILDDNNFEGGIEGISQLPNLQRFHVGNNLLSGAIPGDELAQCTSMQYFWLYDNGFTGPIPTQVSQMTNLITFDVIGNDLTGRLPAYFNELPNLQTLYLGENDFSGSIPSSYGDFQSLTELNLESMGLTGVIPVPLGNHDFSVLRLGGNPFTATPIPDWIYTKTNLTDLRLHNSNLIGEISADGLEQLSNLEVLYLYSNIDESTSPPTGTGSLEGPIPTTIGDLTSLVDLRLYGNNFAGELPLQIGQCTSLTYVDIEYNSFTGEVPFTMVNLDVLEFFYLQFNDFQGSIPSGLCVANSTLVQLVPDCEIQCDCCTPPYEYCPSPTAAPTVFVPATEAEAYAEEGEEEP